MGQVGEESKKQMSGKVEDEWSREEEDELAAMPSTKGAHLSVVAKLPLRQPPGSAGSRVLVVLCCGLNVGVLPPSPTLIPV